jgi:hypothetical protein
MDLSGTFAAAPNYVWKSTAAKVAAVPSEWKESRAPLLETTNNPVANTSVGNPTFKSEDIK